MAKRKKRISTGGKSRFYLIIGENGAVLSYFTGKQLNSRLFAPSPSQADRRDFNSLFTAHPNTPIYLLLDTMEQTYTKISLPAVSMLGIGKLVKRRIERDFKDSDLKSALLFGREEKGRKDWIYMFVSASLSPAVREWLDYILSLTNPFGGIYILSLEMGNLIKRLNKNTFKGKDKSDKPSSWQMLITHNKTGGFRQVVLQNEKVVFSRLIRPGKDNIPDLLAGNTEQEILNTIEYLRRLSFGDQDRIDIYVIVSTDIKRSMGNMKIPHARIKLLTPYEAVELANLPPVALPEDKFTDLLLAASFSMARPVKKFHFKDTLRVDTYLMLYKALTATAGLAVPAFLLYTGFIGYSIFTAKKDIQGVENEKVEIETKWREAQKTSNYDIDDANKITDMVNLHKQLTAAQALPFPVVTSMAEVQKNNAHTKSFDWLKEATQGNQNPKIVITFTMDFFNTGNSIDELFTNFDTFTGNIRKTFSDYQVEHSKLPDKVNFSSQTKIINIQVSLSQNKGDAAAGGTAGQ